MNLFFDDREAGGGGTFEFARASVKMRSFIGRIEKAEVRHKKSRTLLRTKAMHIKYIGTSSAMSLGLVGGFLSQDMRGPPAYFRLKAAAGDWNVCKFYTIIRKNRATATQGRLVTQYISPDRRPALKDSCVAK